MPMTLSGRLVAIAGLMIGIDDVFEARMASSLTSTWSSREEVTLGELVLDDRFDHQIARSKVREVARGAESLDCEIELVGGELAFGDGTLHRRGHPLDRDRRRQLRSRAR